MIDRDRMVSVIMPCYNSERYLREAILSVTAQTYPNWELIAVDDGSTDRTSTILQSFSGKDDRIRVIPGEHRGSAAARNFGMKHANGRYIAFLDSDDVWKRDLLEKQLAFMREGGYHSVCCGYAFMDENSREIRRPVLPKPVITPEDMMVTNRVGLLTGMYDTRACGKIRFDDALGSLRDDYAFWIEVVRKAGRIGGNREILASYRVLPGSTTGRKLRLIGVQYRFYRKYLKQSRLTSVRHLISWGTQGMKKYYFPGRTGRRG